MKDEFELLWSIEVFFQGNYSSYEKYIEFEIETRKMISYAYLTTSQ